MTEAEETYYTEERWQNWLSRVDEEDLDPESEESARLLFNMQDDAAIAVAKVLSAYKDGSIDDEVALEEIRDIGEIVLSEAAFESEEKLILVDGVQMSLRCVFAAAEEYVAGGPAPEGTIGEHVEAAVAAEEDEDLDTAFAHTVQAGTLLIEDDDELDVTVLEDIEYGLVSDWVSGLDSLQSALADPEVIEKEDDE
ncbi:DUF2150 family protein [Salinigranum marinum]|uniref:DUF2150 family protein n=1 Tax=Salinigranum marinum TaxID=1515595 RepID=UPI002989D6EE|nr:DUF2150 family protein [Salinigranum marinum]